MVLNAFENEQQNTETLVWNKGQVTESQEFQADSLTMSTESENYQRIQGKVRFINEVGRAGTIDPLDLRICGDCAPSVENTVATVQPSLNDMTSPFNTQAYGIVRLRIGSRRAAEIRDLGELRQNSDAKSETQICRLRELGSSSYCAAELPSVNVEDELVQELPKPPICRRIGGLWSYKSIRNSPTNKSTSVMPPKKNAETQIYQEQTETAMTDSVANTPTQHSCQSLRSSAAERQASIHKGQEIESSGTGNANCNLEIISSEECCKSIDPVSLHYSNMTMTLNGSFSTPSPSKSAYDPDCGPQYSPITLPSSSLARDDSQRTKSFSPFWDNHNCN